ncbi:MAG: prephenate dehydrogenase [Anaeroplasmataceae bacterium]|nr:prephenate dehydrogenase [Anaeroplasmataceae bacterium]
MRIGIVGLGLMGGSYAIGLSKKGHTIYGMDLNSETLNYALENHIIDSVLSESNISLLDVLILAIYPQSILNFLKNYQKFFKKDLIITDICGVKSSFVKEATKLASPAIYCSAHPMAGKEKIGIEFADETIFIGANYIITPLEDTPQFAIKTLEKIGEDLGFAKISIVSPLVHDDMIGFTSQLTHAIAVSLVNSDHNEQTGDFIGDSYRDLTRIAMINENLWSELFLENKDFLLNHINQFEIELEKLKEALKKNDKEELKKIFVQSTNIRKKMEKCAN